MLPFIAEESKRNIDLRGSFSQSSHAAILTHARALRSSRRDERLREDAAIKIQRWLKAQRQAQAVRVDIRSRFDLGPQPAKDGTTFLEYVDWTRLLVICGADEKRLTRWSTVIMTGVDDLLVAPLRGSQAESWLVLLRQVSLLLLKCISRNAGSQGAATHLQILHTLLSPSSWKWPSRTIEMPSPLSFSRNIATYLLQRNMLVYLAQALEQVPLSSKEKTQASVYLSRLLASSFSLFDEKLSPHPTPSITTTRDTEHKFTFLRFLTHILTIPLLPNRIPLAEIPKLLSCIPWEDLPMILSLPSSISPISPLTYDSSSLDDILRDIKRPSRPHLLANLLAFLPPRYSKLSQKALSAYLELFTALLDGLNVGDLDPPRNNPSLDTTPFMVNQTAEDEDDEDDEDVAMDVERSKPSGIVDLSLQNPSSKSQEGAQPFAPLDNRTLSRLETLTASSHLSSLFTATSRHPNSRAQIFRFILSLTVTLPTKRDHIWTTISVIPGGGSGLIRECWRGYVRSCPLGKVENENAVKALMEPSNARAWPPLLFLVSVYTHSLLTIGDDEFFSLSTTSGAALRNPLSLDDLVTFSRQLLNIALPLYWFEDQAKVKESGPSGVRITWEKVRELVSGCLKGIHARDSRRPFTPPSHWLITSQVDLHSFVEAAVTEEQTLSNSDSVHASSSRRRRRTGLSPRQLAYLSPRLGILNNIPFAIPFELRVEIFRQFIKNDFSRAFATDREPGVRSFHLGFDRIRRKRVTVRREHIAQDGYDELSNMGAELKGTIEIQFVDKFGQEEAGIDGGGVFKEFLTSLSKEVFDTNRGLWLSTSLQELYPNPHSYATEPHQLNWYRFIGRILGKALYEGILVDVAFASFFLSKWLGKQSYLDDLASLDPELYNGLIFLKHYDKNFEDLFLNFTITEEDLGVTRSVNLIPNGEQTSVTRENRLQYIYLVSHYRLSRQIKRQSEAFFEGLSDIIDPKWLRMFNQQEVQILVGGVNAPIDLEDLRQNCNYGGFYDDSEDTIQIFWKVANSFDQEQRRGLLRFVTSCSRPPLLGFKELYPKFCIRDSSNDEQRLPTSSTCVNLLKLPRYRSEKIMREKLLQAINSGAGFDLS